MSTEVTFIIIDGDNKLDLFQQLMFVGMKDSAGKLVSKLFRVVGHCDESLSVVSTSVEYIHITGIEAEDGSGESWIITGYYPAHANGNNLTSKGGTFKGYYNTRHRSGRLTIAFY